MNWPSPEKLQESESVLREFYTELLEHINSQRDLHVFAETGYSEDKVWEQIETLLAIKSESLPLYGVPIGIKDIINVDGFETRAGSQLPASCFAGKEASVVTKLREHGAILIGKTVTTEFAGRTPGRTRNPCNPEHTPGGSSSGSAAGVAAGCFPLALGTQTSGSVIRPASYCGVIGFKPGFAELPTDGVFPLAPSLDHVGLFAASCDWVIRIVAALGLADSGDASLKTSLRFAIPTGSYLDKASERAQEAVYSFAVKLENCGHKVFRVSLFEDIDEIHDRHYTLLREEALGVHRQLFAEYGELYREAFAAALADGSRCSNKEVQVLRESRVTLEKELQKQLFSSDIDYVLAPATVDVAPSGLAETGSAIMNLVWTNAGLPVLSLPCAKHDGLPLSVQLIAARGSSWQLLVDASKLAGRT